MSLSRRFALSFVPLAVACSDTSAPTPSLTLDGSEQIVATSGNDFSFALFRQIAKNQKGQNVFISPLSASMSLGMAMNGAAGSTLDGMRTALQLGTGDVSQIDAGYKGLIEALRGLDATTTFKLAN